MTPERLDELAGLPPGMALPLSTHLMGRFWTLFSPQDGEEWAVADISGGGAYTSMRAAYLVAAANALPDLIAALRAEWARHYRHRANTQMYTPGQVGTTTPVEGNFCLYCRKPWEEGDDTRYCAEQHQRAT